jgi:hypothetical protein
MNKEKFLEIASQIYDNLNIEANNKILVSKGVLDEITDRISSELFDKGEDLIDNYNLKIIGNNEIQIERLRLDFRTMDQIIQEVLNTYFTTN